MEGPGSAERNRRLNRRFRAAAPAKQSGLRRFAGILLATYWLGCLGVIGLGLDRLYPDIRGTFTRPALAPATVADFAEVGEFAEFPAQTFRGAPRYDYPFRTCAAAHAAGVYDIPVGSPAYNPRQDGDDDGLACEPPRGAY